MTVIKDVDFATKPSRIPSFMATLTLMEFEGTYDKDVI